MSSKFFKMSPSKGVTEQWFIDAKNFNPRKIFTKWGMLGVRALAEATPRDTGTTAGSWSYKIENAKGNWSLSFINSNVVDYVVVAIILQYGHLTKSGTFYQGTDYINPAIQPIFDGLQKDLDKELSDL